MKELFEYFKAENVLQWLKEVFIFFLKPRLFVSQIGAKPLKEIISQYGFYFISYSVFFIFISTDYSLENLFKLSVTTFLINLISSLSVVATSFIIFRKTKFKQVLLYIFSCFVFFVPIAQVFFYIFLSFEDYVYYLFFNCINCFALVYLNYVSGVAVTATKWMALKFILVNYLILNISVFVVEQISFDKFAPNPTLDPIFTEYVDNFDAIQEKENIPTLYFVSSYNNKIYPSVGTQNVIVDSMGHSGTNKDLKYKSDVIENIKMLTTKVETLNHFRNRQIFQSWLNYYTKINGVLDPKFEDEQELIDKKFTRIGQNKTPWGEMRHYYKILDISEHLKAQMQLKDYHNSFVSSVKKANAPVKYFQRAHLLAAYILDDIWFRLFYEGKKSVYKDRFNSFDDD